MQDLIVAIDLGGTQIRAALADQDGVFSKIVRRETNAGDSADEIFGRISEVVQELSPDFQCVRAIGLGAPGPVDPWRGVLLSAPNLPGMIDFPIQAQLERRFRVPAFIGNDANVAALGEHRYGAGRGNTNLIYLTISTGIGGGIIAENKLFLGSRGFAGEVGHQTLEARGSLCRCGNVGCLESLAAGPAIAQSARDALTTGRASVLQKSGAITAKEVVDAARGGDKLAIQVLERAGFYIGVGIVSLVNNFDTQLFVLGGSVAIHAWDFLYPSMLAALDKHAMPAMRKGVRIVRAELGDDSGLKGAVALVTSRI